jgi:hypothetical protein
VWRRRERGRVVEIRVEPFGRLSRAQQAELADEAARVGRTHGADAALEIV